MADADVRLVSRAHTQGDGSSFLPGRETTDIQPSFGVHAEPKYQRNPQPSYPLSARRQRQEGLVVLTVKVTALGRAELVEFKHSSGFPALDEAAIQAVRRWQFQPARIDSIAVDSVVEIPVRFRLTE